MVRSSVFCMSSFKRIYLIAEIGSKFIMLFLASSPNYWSELIKKWTLTEFRYLSRFAFYRRIWFLIDKRKSKQMCSVSESISGPMFSPPTLARCATDSPSHYFLRGTHRWSSTPLIKVHHKPTPVLQKVRNAGIWNSSKMSYLRTILSYLLIIFIYCKLNFHKCW